MVPVSPALADPAAPPTPDPRKRTHRLVRWVVRGMLVSGLLMLGAASLRRQLRAKATAQLLATGGQVLRFAGPAPGEADAPPRTIVLNGAELTVVTGNSTESIAAILDGFQARCGAADFLPAPGAAAPTGSAAPAAAAGRPPAAVRGGDAPPAFLAGGLAGLGDVDPTAMAAAAQDFVDSGDLASVGGLRYVYGEVKDGVTRWVGMAAAGLSVAGVFPTTGDAPGGGSLAVPRPAEGRRILDLAERGQPYEMSVYTGLASSPADAARDYQRILEAVGFTVMPGRRNERRGDAGQSSMLISRGDVFAAVVAFVDGDVTTVAVAAATDAGFARLRQLLPPTERNR